MARHPLLWSWLLVLGLAPLGCAGTEEPQPGLWIPIETVPNVSSGALAAAWGDSLAELLVPSGGALLRLSADYSEWETVLEDPVFGADEPLTRMLGRASDDLWLVAGDRLYHWDGSTANLQPQPTMAQAALTWCSTGELWLVGDLDGGADPNTGEPLPDLPSAMRLPAGAESWEGVGLPSPEHTPIRASCGGGQLFMVDSQGRLFARATNDWTSQPSVPLAQSETIGSLQTLGPGQLVATLERPASARLVELRAGAWQSVEAIPAGSLRLHGGPEHLWLSVQPEGQLSRRLFRRVAGEWVELPAPEFIADAGVPTIAVTRDGAVVDTVDPSGEPLTSNFVWLP